MPNMNSKENNLPTLGNRETRVEGLQETNDNRSQQRETEPCQVKKCQKKLSSEQFKLNNNVGEENGQPLSPRSTHLFAPDTRALENIASVETTICSGTPTSASGGNTSGSYILGYANASQTYSNPSGVHSNSTSCTGETNGKFSSSCTSQANFSNAISMFPATSMVAENGCKTDTDMRNNVDYGSAIEKYPPKVACSSDLGQDNHPAWTSGPFIPNHGMNNIGSSIGSTSQGTCCFLRPNINGSREVPGPSGVQRVSPRDSERRDSSSENEGDTSDGEDCCFYTYKGNDNPADAEFGPPLGPNEGLREEGEAEPRRYSGSSSPEMDFLEMDFDPGPSCEQDTGDSDMASISEDIQNIALDSVEPESTPLNDLSSGRVPSRLENAPANQQTNQKPANVEATTSRGEPECSFNQTPPSQAGSSHWTPSTSSGEIERWEATGFRRSNNLCPLQESYGHHNTNGDLISPGDNRDSGSELWSGSASGSNTESSNLDARKVNLSSALYHRMMAKKLMLNKQTTFNQSGDSNLESELFHDRAQSSSPVEKIMLWSEQEATVKQVTQIGTSACGATAAINALLALDVAFSLEVLVRGVGTRLREPGTPLPRYLLSRSNAGVTHKDIARGISLASSGAVTTKFFAFYPERNISLSHWLHYWIARGAVPIATLNLQHCGEGKDIPDAWHHQMIFGVGPAGIYLTNPLQCVPEQVVWHQLVSPSVLLIRKQDVLAHWSPVTDLKALTLLDQRWRTLNVLGQIVNLVRETMGRQRQNPSVTTGVTHICIPASYRAGITLVMRSDAPAAAELLRTEQLPLV